MNQDVLKKLLRTGLIDRTEVSSENLVKEFLAPKTEGHKKILVKRPGRPKKEDHLKAKNFTLCLDPKYLAFLDNMKVHDKKVQGRGRKVRFIIDQFLEHHRRERHQLEVLGEALQNVEVVLKGYSSQVKKGQKLELRPLEKAQITKAVSQVNVLLRVLGFTKKELHKVLPRGKWALLAFCLDWTIKQKAAL